MMFDIRYNNHPEDSKQYDTTKLRERYLIESVFVDDRIRLVYSHHDRIIAGGIKPVETTLSLPMTKDLGTGYFLERRELGAINVGGEGEIVLDGTAYPMKKLDSIYVGAGTKDVLFRSKDKSNPAKFYVNSAPAHKTYPTVHIPLDKARKVELGSPENLNVRTIHQIVHPAVCQSCQLVMGVTILKPGSVWNSMPSHTHARRMEVYFYFDMAESTRIFHFMGEPTETRHLILKNEEAVISPSWSIHSGVGTSNYTFIWGMCGENQTFDDMDFVDLKTMR